MSELLHWVTDPPAVRHALLIVALDGFVDAGSAASSASAFLRHRWRAEPIARFDGDALIDYRARRPTAVVDSGVVRRIDWPELELLVATLDDAPRDALLLLGPEPDMRWHAFAEEVAAVCVRLGVEQVVQLGAYPAATPHTRPVAVSRARNRVTQLLEFDGVDVSGYTGPINASTVLQAELARHDIPAVGLWAEVPHYIATNPHPPAALALAERIADALGVAIDTTELRAAATLHLEQVADAVAEHEDAVSMVTALEQMVDAGEDDEDLPTGDDLAAEIEHFLEARRDD
ncbi:MAG: PAC2 family protein [Actinobacteria bacterium]|nr:PAC2 family protein [Actinomycetota bacterium]